jgi:hypothetical protein
VQRIGARAAVSVQPASRARTEEALQQLSVTAAMPADSCISALRKGFVPAIKSTPRDRERWSGFREVEP